MNARSRRVLSSLAALWLSACSSSVSVNMPVPNPVDPVASNSLHFAVGTATISNQGLTGIGLNVVETLRQSNGLSGTLFNVPTITGPASFAITATSPPLVSLDAIATLAGADFGSNRISQQTFDNTLATGYNPLPQQGGNPTAIATTGAFGYGLCACNANSGPINGFPQLYHAYLLPFYAVMKFGNGPGGQSLANLQYYGGPPAFPSAPPEIAQKGFLGYSVGFSDFAIAPAAGQYRLDVALPPDFNTPANAATPTLSATAQLSTTQGLPVFPVPQFHSDVGGGGTIIVNVPAGVTEAMVFIQEGQTAPSGIASPYCPAGLTIPTYYTFFVKGSGVQSITVPDSISPNGGPTLCSGAPFFVYAAGFDYPAFEAAYPQSTTQNPAITNGTNGQADVTTSDALAVTY